MNLQELKQAIIDKNIPSGLIIFKYDSDSSLFLIEQYLDEMCKVSGRIINNISSLKEMTKSALALVLDYTSELNVLKTEEFDEFNDNYETILNTVIICKKIDKKLEKVVVNYIIKIPELQEWQIIDYMRYICPGLSDNSYLTLMRSANLNVYRIKNELDKLLLFDESERERVICECFESKGGDLYYFSDYEISNAISDFNGRKPEAYNTLVRYFKHKDSHPLKTKGKTVNDELLDFVGARIGGISAKGNYYGVLGTIFKKYNYPRSITKDIFALEFLTEIDLKIKSGDLDFSNDLILDYVIIRLLSLNKFYN